MQDKKVNVGVIILNYNGLQHTLKCINNLRHAAKKVRLCTINIVVVDNASTDGSEESLRIIQEITFIQSSKNGGFASGCNMGIKHCQQLKYDYILLLNNDASIIEGTIDDLIKSSQLNNNHVLISVPIFNPDQSMQSLGGYINKLTGKVKLITAFKNHNKVEFLTGCCMLIPNEVLNTIGLLDERFFMYWEDVDYCWRAKKAGLKLIIEHKLKVSHAASSTANNNLYLKQFYANQSEKKFMMKHGCYRACLTSVCLRVVKCFFIKNNWWKLKPIIHAWLKFDQDEVVTVCEGN
jgi:GT2 family glycosyltransferase